MDDPTDLRETRRTKASGRAAVGLGALSLSVGLVACASATEQPAIGSAAPVPGTAETEASGDVVEYDDGEYTATGWYGGLPSHHDVTLTIADDVVTAVEITTPAEDETSLGYQRRFAEALPAAVIGRSVDEISVDRLAGSSGCSEGFMDALAQIREQAAA